MAVDDGAGAGIGTIDLQMQQQLAGAETIAGKDVAIKVGEADVGRLQITLAEHCRSAEHVVGVETGTDVSASAIDVFALPQLAAHGDDLGAEGIGFERVDRGGGGNMS